MSEGILIFLGGLAGSVITIIGQIIIASLNARTRQEKTASLLEQYLKLSSMSAKEIEEKLNLISTLGDRIDALTVENRTLKIEIADIKVSRVERDEEMESMQSHISSLQAQINLDAIERTDLRKKLSDIDVKYRVLFQYLYASVEHMIKNNVKPLPVPKELESNPELMRLLNKE